MIKPKAIIYFNQLSENPGPDELDVLEQTTMAEEALKDLGYEVQQLPFSFDLPRAIQEIRSIKPYLIFNLVESIDNHGEFCYFAPALFNFLKVPYTGVRLEGMFNTTGKVQAKEMFRARGIPTADWFGLHQAGELVSGKQYIRKPIWEDGSLGIDENSVFRGGDPDFIRDLKKLQPNRYFIEELVDGREFNISVLGGHNGPEVLPIAEMQFIGYPDDKPKILGYEAKWMDNSFEYAHTGRTFDTSPDDDALHAKLREISLKCWKDFGMKGYIRVDLRVDRQGNPYVLEINANPCLSDNGGFFAACRQRGYSFKDIIERIVEDAFTD